MAHKTRIMYIESKGGQFDDDQFGNPVSRPASLIGAARIGRVTYSKTGKSLYYQGLELRSLKGSGFKSNYLDVTSGEQFWISGPKKRGGDALYATNIPAEIDEDVRAEYWTQIRNQPERIAEKHT